MNLPQHPRNFVELLFSGSHRQVFGQRYACIYLEPAHFRFVLNRSTRFAFAYTVADIDPLAILSSSTVVFTSSHLTSSSSRIVQLNCFRLHYYGYRQDPEPPPATNIMPPRTRVGTKLTAKVSSDAVFDAAELLEMILLQLPVNDLLLNYRVCKQWKSAIDASPNVQKALFMRPEPLTSVFEIDRSHPGL